MITQVEAHTRSYALQAEIVNAAIDFEQLQRRAAKQGMTVSQTCRQGFLLQAPCRLFFLGDREATVKQLIQLAREKQEATAGELEKQTE